MHEPPSLWQWIKQAGGAHLRIDERPIELSKLATGSFLQDSAEALRDRTVLIATAEAWHAALGLVELDGVARRMVLCPPDLAAAHLPTVIERAQADACLRTVGQEDLRSLGLAQTLYITPTLSRGVPARRASRATEWVLLTSGTSGPPKLVLHSLSSLTSAFAPVPAKTASAVAPTPVWSTFYDIRRYGGLQILLRALAGATLVLSNPALPLGERLAALAAERVTHLTGTASHWRAVLMSGEAQRIAPGYVRLSGEIADQGILDALHAGYPAARIEHAFASTEAGVAFEVADGLAGFPAAWVGGRGGLAELRVRDGCLQVRSPGSARGYLESGSRSLRDVDGFVDTGDRVELRGGRYYFIGRSGGIINVGGLKVHPEEVEAVINSHPWVRMSRVQGRRSPITGAVVTAEVVLASDAPVAQLPEGELLSQLLQHCRTALAAHKVPVQLRVVSSLPLSAAGKLVRSDG